MSSTPPMPPPEDESVVQHLMRSTKNAFTKCFGCAKTADDKAKIKYAQYHIENRKKKFGVDYLNLKLAGGTADETGLQTLVDEALADIATLTKEIEEHEASILKKQESTKKKLVTITPAATGAGQAAAPAETAATPAETPALAPATETKTETETAAPPAAETAAATPAEAPAPAAATETKAETETAAPPAAETAAATTPAPETAAATTPAPETAAATTTTATEEVKQ